jgi:hypothetical protein
MELYSIVTPLNIRGKILNRLIIGLTTKGCEYARTKGGCSMCGFMKYADKDVTDRQIIDQFEKTLEMNDLNALQAIEIYNGGSFLNDNEISSEVRRTLLEKISEIPSIERVFIESRPEYINAEKLLQCRQWAGDKEIEVGIGLESSDDYIRNILIRKNMPEKDFIRAVEEMSKAKCDLFVYLLIKPPGLTEKQAIEDSVNSASYVFGIARRCKINARVGLEPVFVPSNTPLENMFEDKEYELLNLWSLIDIIRRVHKLGNVHVGLDDEGLSQGRMPYSCENCYEKLLDEITIFNKTQSFANLDSFDCDCRNAG